MSSFIKLINSTPFYQVVKFNNKLTKYVDHFEVNGEEIGIKNRKPITVETPTEPDEPEEIVVVPGLYNADGNLLAAITKDQLASNYVYNINLPQTLGVNSTDVAKVIVPDNSNKIGNYAFYGCTGLVSIGAIDSGSSIEFPSSLWSIGDYTFANCSNLTSVTMTNNMSHIGQYAFYGCSKLTKIDFENTSNSWFDANAGGWDEVTDPSKSILVDYACLEVL